MGVNEYGLLSIKVQDTETGRSFDLDGMSSGEKGLFDAALTGGSSTSLCTSLLTALLCGREFSTESGGFPQIEYVTDDLY